MRLHVSLLAIVAIGCESSPVPAQPPRPRVVAVAPRSGLPGQAVEISGSNLAGSTVRFDEMAIDLAMRTSASLTFYLPKLAPGTYAVTVDDLQAGPFEVLQRTVTSLTPRSGERRALVEARGTHLQGASVRFGDLPVELESSEPSRITFRVPDVVRGNYEVWIDDVDGGEFKVEPSVSDVKPREGLPGVAVSIRGTNLSGASVRLGSEMVDLRSDHPDELSFALPALSPGKHRIAVDETDAGFFEVGSVTTVKPREGCPGTPVEVEGVHLANAVIRLGETPLDLTANTPDRVEFEVPELTSTPPGSYELQVEALDVGPFRVTPLRVDHIDPPGGVVGSLVVIAGANLEGWPVLLNETQVVPESTTYSEIRFRIPQLHAGVYRLTVGEVPAGDLVIMLSFEVLPTLVRPGEPLIVLTDQPVLDAITGVKLGNRTLLAAEQGKLRAVPPAADGRERFVIAVPEDLGPGKFDLQLLSDTVQAKPVPVTFSIAAVDGVLVPPTPKNLQFPPPTNVATGFPIGTHTGAEVKTKRGPTNNWWYYGFTNCQPTFDSTDVEGFGEYYWDDVTAPASVTPAYLGILGLGTAARPKFVHPMTLKWSFAGEDNWAEATVDRSSSGGSVEVYDGVFGPTDVCTDSVVAPALLVLTSRSSGRQLMIDLGTPQTGGENGRCAGGYLAPQGIFWSVSGAPSSCAPLATITLSGSGLTVSGTTPEGDGVEALGSFKAGVAEGEAPASLKLTIKGLAYSIAAGGCRMVIDETTPFLRGHMACTERATAPGQPSLEVGTLRFLGTLG